MRLVTTHRGYGGIKIALYPFWRFKMKKFVEVSYMFRALLLFTGLTASGMILASRAHATACPMGIYKTYLPRSSSKAVCDDKNLPAEFANDLTSLVGSLKKLGYDVVAYDQCANGNNDKNAYSLISQLGGCVQTGASIKCKVYVGLYDNRTNRAVYENTIPAAGADGFHFYINEALSSLPRCADLNVK